MLYVRRGWGNHKSSGYLNGGCPNAIPLKTKIMRLTPWVGLVVSLLYTLIVAVVLVYHTEHKVSKAKFPVSTHDSANCGFCTLSGKAIQYVNAQDYQLDISSIPDSIIIMDGRRYVGTIPMWDKSPLDSLLWKDNE